MKSKNIVKQKKIDNPIWQERQKKWWYDFWSKVKPPWRPSKKEIEFWENIIKTVLRKKKSIRVLILGATPEFRDMLAKYKKIEVTMIDLNPLVKVAMDRLRKRKNPREKLIVGSWLEMKKIFPQNYFDIVMNDEGFENIAVKNHNQLHRNIRYVLKKDGYFLVGRLCLEYCFKYPLTMKKVIQKYKKNPKFFHNFQNRIWYLYRLTVSEQGCYDHRIQGVKMHILMRKILKRAKKENIKNPKYLLWEPILNYDSFEYVEVDLASLKRLKSMIQKYFEIEKVYKDLFHPVMKIKYNFVLKPKKAESSLANFQGRANKSSTSTET